MIKIFSFAGPARRRRWRTTLGLGVTAGVMTAATLASTSLPANAAVDPKNVNSRFISITNKCATGADRGLSYRVTGRSANGTIWKVWIGSVSCTLFNPTNKALFGWTPANPTDRLSITITTSGGDRNEYIAGDQNFCLWIGSDGVTRGEKNSIPRGTSLCNPW